MFIYHSPEFRIRVTIVGKYDEKTQTLCFAASRCSENDRFIRKLGVDIATQRLNDGSYFSTISVGNKKNLRGIFYWLVNEYYSDYVINNPNILKPLSPEQP